MLGALSLPAVGGIDVAKFAGVPGVVDTPSANELSGNQYEDVTSENVSPMANIQELFMEMAYDLKSIAINTFETNEILRDAAPSGADMRDIGIGEEDRGEDDEDKEDKKEKSGILSSLAGVFKGLDMGFGDKMKMLLFGTLLLGITKYFIGVGL